MSLQARLLADVKRRLCMYDEMLVAEMRDHQSLMEYEKLFLEEIGPTLTALPGVQSAHVAAKKRSLFLVVMVVWSSRQIAEQWCEQQGHRRLIESLRPLTCGNTLGVPRCWRGAQSATAPAELSSSHRFSYCRKNTSSFSGAPRGADRSVTCKGAGTAAPENSSLP